MNKFGHHQVGVDAGDAVLFNDFSNDGVMWTGEGQRETRQHINFSEAFVLAPVVTVRLTMFDVSNAANVRVDVQAEDINTTGFSIVFRTWGDTKIARVRIGWQAIGPVRDDDVWDVK